MCTRRRSRRSCSQHPGVRDVGVVAAPHAVKGEAPVAGWSSARRGLSEDDLKRFFLARGPAYAHPRRVFFVDRLPVGGTDKLDRKRLQEQAAPAEGTEEGGGATSTMRAAIIREHGRSGSLEYGDIERREPARARCSCVCSACALNHLDIFVRRGMPGVPLDLPHMLRRRHRRSASSRLASAAGEQLVGTDGAARPAWSGRHALGERPRADSRSTSSRRRRTRSRWRGRPSPRAYAALPVAYGTARRMLLAARARLTEGETVARARRDRGVGVACVQVASRARRRVDRLLGARGEAGAAGRAGGRRGGRDPARLEFARSGSWTGKNGRRRRRRLHRTGDVAGSRCAARAPAGAS